MDLSTPLSPNCAFCGDPESNQHIFFDCHRALVAWSEFQNCTGVIPTYEIINKGIRDPWLNNIISIVKGQLAKNRDDEIDPRSMAVIIKNRMEDLETINLNKNKFKQIRAQKKVIMAINR